MPKVRKMQAAAVDTRRRQPATHRYAAVSSRPQSSTRQTREGQDDPAWWPGVAWTVGWFVVPVLLYLGWALTRTGTAAPGCVDIGGGPCQSPRATALAALGDTAIGLVGSLALALLALVMLRRLANTWRAGTVGFAAAVMGTSATALLLAMLA